MTLSLMKAMVTGKGADTVRDAVSTVWGFPHGHSPHSFVNIIKARTYLVLIQSQPLQGD